MTDMLPPPPPALPPEEAAERHHARGLRVAAGGGVAVLVAAAVTGGILAFRLLHGSADSLVTMAPSDTEAYVNVDLDPSAGQKLAIDSLLGKFPGLGGSSRDQTINGWLDTALRTDGLDHSDVRSWLGSQISVLALARSGAVPGVAALLSSTNDAGAQSMFAKLDNHDGSVRAATTTRDGVTVTIEHSRTGAAAWAITDHTVIIGSTQDAVDEVIDTTQGKHAALTSMADFTKVQSQLPADRVAFVYVDAGALARQLTTALSGLGGVAGVPSSAKGLNALRGIGEAIVVNSSGIALDGTQNYDAAALSATQRALLGLTPHPNGMLRLIPAQTYGFLALEGFPQIVQAVIGAVGSGPGDAMNRALGQFGITGPGGLLTHLTGDAGITVDHQTGSSIPAGAVMFATDSHAAAASALETIATAACGVAGGCDSSQATSQPYEGVTITTLPISGVDGVSPSWAVDGDWAIIASSPAEVRSVIDATRTGGVATASRYAGVAGKIGSDGAVTIYLDIHAVVAAVRAILPAEAQQQFDRSVAPYLTPFQSFGMTEQGGSDHSTTTAFLLIG